MRDKLKQLIPVRLRPIVQKIRGRSVFHDYYVSSRCIFIHIPKAAGQSVSLALFNDKHPGHYPIKKFEWEDRERKENYFKFTVVRNPWDRLYSAFNYLTKHTPYKADQEFAKNYLSEYKSFEDFVLYGLDKPIISNWVHFRPQSYFLLDLKEELDINYIARFENLEEDFQHIARELGRDMAELKKVNSSGRELKSYQKQYTNTTMQIVAKHYELDINLLGYEF